EREQWDTNHDGVIDQTEYSNYFRAFQERQNSMSQGGMGFGQGGWGQIGNWGNDQGGYQGGGYQGGGWGGYGPQQGDQQVARQEEKKAVVYRAGKLPDNLPAWFKELDRDQDGQVALYEWKAADRSVEDFVALDRNGDGFITFQEAIHSTIQPKEGGNGS